MLSSQLFIILPLFLLCNLLLLDLAKSQTFPDCHPHDKKILLRIKNHLGNPSSLSTWTKSEKYCCALYHGVVYDLQGRVSSLNFYDIHDYHGTIPTFLDRLPGLVDLSFMNIPNLSGPIPPYIGNLTNLISFSMVSTNLGGPIPDIISRFNNLLILTMSDNNHVGPIPRFLSQMSNLTRLDLSSNKLTGQIPAFLGRLKRLDYLRLSSNKLTGPIPLPLVQLTNLNSLNLSSNKLSGPIPDFIGIHLINLRTLELDSNHFSGHIPKSLGQLPNLQSLSLSKNKLNWPIPKSLGLANILVIKLAYNNLSGDASFLFNKNNMATFELIINNNKLKFDFSNAGLGRLVSFNISHNMIYGSLPEWFGQLYLDSTRIVDVSYNQLCGPIPNGRRFKRFGPSMFAHNKCLCGGPLPACK
ncbi:uncharacterized protein LOC141649949 [Silene latifolia]|uniref:uncharacterized protein LOC141649949 n=1 Tax=Silene latifolia TaxID=37657 RepID=UPI003D77EEE6